MSRKGNDILGQRFDIMLGLVIGAADYSLAGWVGVAVGAVGLLLLGAYRARRA